MQHSALTQSLAWPKVLGTNAAPSATAPILPPCLRYASNSAYELQVWRELLPNHAKPSGWRMHKYLYPVSCCIGAQCLQSYRLTATRNGKPVLAISSDAERQFWYAATCTDFDICSSSCARHTHGKGANLHQLTGCMLLHINTWGALVMLHRAHRHAAPLHPAYCPDSAAHHQLVHVLCWQLL